MQPDTGVALQFVPAGMRSEKSPFSHCGCGTLSVSEAAASSRESSKAKKKKVRLLGRSARGMGPPIVPPSWYLYKAGWGAVAPNENSRASRTAFLANRKPDP